MIKLNIKQILINFEKVMPEVHRQVKVYEKKLKLIKNGML